ncbi:hypothetical protein CC1G_14270 [Coprinopsis cinerea okayama7|uniref:Uncharacterized protein n=1 Tax=Coprinopsis cinerea (strain Okayama-7 / 130 / ATCC MYA-4618 / FGSC 9003) TaxID=240176 RepID=D6RLR2_COPC7|nr:hypothetical protein CC1G_14270 [Coprinopsis cinerea okayama7\|eukprot:XP_002911739.1 hypothetical protein CC1G_14270 [Coprinopsis cinerea okayama7\
MRGNVNARIHTDTFAISELRFGGKTDVSSAEEKTDLDPETTSRSLGTDLA